MNKSLLENPIWNSLRTDHSHLAQGDDCARRYPHEIGPLAGIPGQSEPSYNSLRSLAGDHPVVLFSLETIEAPRTLTVIRTGRVVQMLRTATASTTPPTHKPVDVPPDNSTPPPPATGSTNPVPTPDHKPVAVPPDTSTAPQPGPISPGMPAPAPTAPSSRAGGGDSSPPCAPPARLPPGSTLRRLTPSDSPSMVALAALTEPGPFRLRTIELGNFYGIFHDDQLVSMAGKRMHVPGFVEVSGVCTHPDARGRGYARTLMHIVINEIEQSGCTPFLHAWHDNPATRLYESLGFSLTRTFHLSVLSAA